MEGEPLKIIYPGRINDDRGADFRDAVITTHKGLAKGDIEIHVNSSDWQGHRHHQDKVYNRVILHVVMRHNSKTATHLQNGKQVPILALNKYIQTALSQLPNLESPTIPYTSCLKITRFSAKTKTMGFIDSAGRERFAIKADRFQTELTRNEASQVLYLGIMEALGYSKNKLPFLEVARRLPIRILESMTQGKISDEEFLTQQQALLLGTAGFLPSQYSNRQQEDKLDDRWADNLEKFWSSYHTKTMSLDAWHLFKVRPNNSPIRRLIAMSYLILRYKDRGIFEWLVSTIRGAPASQKCLTLEKGLLVTTNDFVASHFNSNSDCTLLGSERAADITVNVLLPFVFAWSQLSSQPELKEKALELYCHHPDLAANSLVRQMMSQLGLKSEQVNSAQRQQGLIHIYKTLCSQGRCNACHASLRLGITSKFNPSILPA